jgi:ribonuclease R
MKEKILELIRNEQYRPTDAKGIVSFLGIVSARELQEAYKALAQLEQEGLIGRNKKDNYNTVERLGYLKGELDLKRGGFGFLIVESDIPSPDVFIPRDRVGDAMDGDRCLVKVTRRSEGNRLEGQIITVLKRALEFVVGEYFQGAVFPKNEIPDILFKVSPKNRKGLTDHTIVKAKILHYSATHILDCQVVEVVGDVNAPGMEILEAIAQYGLETEFPLAVKEEVKQLSDHVLLEELRDRIDLREDVIFTIDGDDTKDIDDAISLSQKTSGNFDLGIHIADVSHYVREGSELDRDALLRGTSVYLADRVIPMLPRELSNGICSLNPQVDRLAISCRMEIDLQGKVVAYSIVPSVIRSRYQMTYTKVNKILAGDPEVRAQYPDLLESISHMEKLTKILFDLRTEKGSINFETIEPKLILDPMGKILDIVVKPRGISEGIIEEFMLMANQTVAAHFMRANLPFLYRIHEDPDADKLAALFKFVKEMGYPTKIPKTIRPQDLQKMLAAVEDTTFDKVVNMMMLRSMAKARYSPDNVGHYGLAFEDYTHFTSPIRRYPDTMVHRLIRTYLFEKKTGEKTKDHFASLLPDVALQTSKCERTAMLCEREVLDMKKAEFMSTQIGSVYQGVVSTLTRFGMFVELPNTVEGLVHVSTFPEAMEFNEEKMLYLGISSRKEYTIGMIVKVRLVKVDAIKGRIDFVLV